MKTLLTLLITFMLGGVFSYWFLGPDSGHDDLLEATAEDDDDDNELDARQDLVEGRLVVNLDADIQANAGIKTQMAEDISLEAEERAFAHVVDIAGLLELRSSYFKLKAEQLVIQSVIGNSEENFQQLSLLHEEAGNISARELRLARAKLDEEKARLMSLQASLNSNRETIIQNWGEVLGELALKTDSEVFNRLLSLDDYLVLVSLKADQVLSSDEAYVLIARSDERNLAQKAYLVSPAPFADQTLQGESFLFRTNAKGLRRGMTLYAWLPGTGFSGSGVHIPREAIIWYAGQPWVYIKIDAEHFARRSLINAIQSRDTWLVQDTIEKGEEIVISGAQTLLSEEFKYAIPDEDDD